MPSPKSPLPFLKETHQLNLPVYFFPVLMFVRRRHPNQLPCPLKDWLSRLILVKRNKVYSFKTEKRESLTAKLNSVSPCLQATEPKLSL